MKISVSTVLSFAFLWTLQGLVHAEPLQRVFVTSVTGTGDLSTWEDAGGASGLAAGDAICQARAAAAGILNPGNFIAWLSDGTDDAYCRIHGLTGKRADNCGQAELPDFAGPWVRMDGFPFAERIGLMLGDQGEFFTSVGLDEFGEHVGSAGYITGTSPETGAVENNTCGDWTDGTDASGAVRGVPDETTIHWTGGITGDCDAFRHLLCLEAGKGPPLPIFARKGRRVFATSVSGPGNLAQWPEAGAKSGLAAGDAICQARASLGGLDEPDSFKAWLSDSTVNAVDRLTNDGPWIRMDGVPVAESLSDLVDGNIFAPINVTELAEHHSTPQTWSGTFSNGLARDINCNDWQDSSAGVNGGDGLILTNSSSWTSRGQSACGDPKRLYCFSDSPNPGLAGAPLAAVLPASRSVEVDNPATVFGTLINPDTTTAIDCAVRPAAYLPAEFSFQTTDPATNEPTGSANAFADVEGGRSQSFVLVITPRAPFEPRDVELLFDCGNSDPAPIVSGLNTLLLSASQEPVPDLIALAATTSQDGIVTLPGVSESAAFAVGTVNLGAQGAITVSADSGDVDLPLGLMVCETDPATSACLAPPTVSVTRSIATNATPTFGVFLLGQGEPVPLDPAVNRVFVRFRDAMDTVRGATSVAVRTL